MDFIEHFNDCHIGTSMQRPQSAEVAPAREARFAPPDAIIRQRGCHLFHDPHVRERQTKALLTGLGI